jgi:hypothetical protein
VSRWAFVCAGLAVVLGCGPAHDAQSPANSPDLLPPTDGVAEELALLDVPAMAPPSEQVLPPPVSPYGIKYKSFYMKKKAYVYAEADRESPQIGTIRRGEHIWVSQLGEKDRKGCRWMEVSPGGWMCAVGKPSVEPIANQVYPSLWKSGYDGRVFRDEADVLADGGYIPTTPPAIHRPYPRTTVKIGSRKYLYTVDGELVPAYAVPRYWGDEFYGVSLQDDSELKLPLGWTWYHDTWKKPTPVYAEPSRDAEKVGELSLRTLVDVLEEDGKWVKIADGQWLEKRDVKVARTATDLPEEVTGDDEVWVDVVLAEQTMIMYRGKTPIHATLAATGRAKFPTPPGVFRIQKKVAKTSFASPRPDVIAYNISDVAWVMKLSGPYAMHGAWWTRGFGRRTSLGCVDLPAKDIKVVFETTEPKIHAGWWEVYPTEENPGSVVRIRKR